MQPLAPRAALAAIRRKAALRTPIGIGACQMNVHDIYGIPTDGTPTAAAAWAKAKHRHPMTTEPPRGAFVYWTGGGTGAGHVAIYAGRAKFNPLRPFRKRARFVWSPGAPADALGGWDTSLRGRWVKIPLHAISPSKDWTTPHVLAGWTEDNDGERVPGLEVAA